LLDVTERTVNRDWHKARAFLTLALEQRGMPVPAEGEAS